MIERLVKMFLVAVLFISISSCEKKSCKNVTCGSGQECYNGACICQDGYEGTDCQTVSNTKYAGSYNVSENCGANAPNFPYYTVYITADPNYPNRILIDNLFGQGSVIAIITNIPGSLGNTLTIQNQNIGALQVSGTGTYYPSNRSMIITFDYIWNGGSYECQHTFYHQ